MLPRRPLERSWRGRTFCLPPLFASKAHGDLVIVRVCLALPCWCTSAGFWPRMALPMLLLRCFEGMAVSHNLREPLLAQLRQPFLERPRSKHRRWILERWWVLGRQRQRCQRLRLLEINAKRTRLRQLVARKRRKESTRRRRPRRPCNGRGSLRQVGWRRPGVQTGQRDGIGGVCPCQRHCFARGRQGPGGRIVFAAVAENLLSSGVLLLALHVHREFRANRLPASGGPDGT